MCDVFELNAVNIPPVSDPYKNKEINETQVPVSFKS